MLIAPNEEERLALLQALAILDTPPEPFFDAIGGLTARAMRAPIVVVALADRERHWFKSSLGLNVVETGYEGAFCSVCIAQDEPLIIPDVLADSRFAKHDMVAGAPGIRSYAGAQLRSSRGLALGTLCVIDVVPRPFTDDDIACLTDAAQVISNELQHREAMLAFNRPMGEVSLALDGEARFRSVFEGAAVGIALIGLDGQWMDVNDALCRLVGYERDELKLLTFQDITHPEDLGSDLRFLEQLARGERERYTIEKRYIKKDGSIIWSNLTVAVRRSPGGAPLYYISIVDDIQERVEAQQALLALQQTLEQRVEARTRELQHAIEQLRMVTDNVPALVAYFDPDLNYRYANEAHRTLLGKDPQALLGHPLSEVLGAASADDVSKKLSASKNEQRITIDLPQRLPGGVVRHTSVTFIPNVIDDALVGFYSLAHDVTERHVREMEREREARQDVLTGLPNRRAFQEGLGRALQQAEAHAGCVTLLFIDLDGFKGINDSLGHECGDLVLKEVARRLLACLRDTDLAARLAGDEFVVIVDYPPDATAVDALATRLLADIACPMTLGAHRVVISASIGIAGYRAGSGKTPEGLLHAADIGMYDAKRAGKNQYRHGPSYNAISN